MTDHLLVTPWRRVPYVLGTPGRTTWSDFACSFSPGAFAGEQPGRKLLLEEGEPGNHRKP